MKRFTLPYLIIFIFLTIGLGSCVSKKKYLRLMTESERSSKSYDNTLGNLYRSNDSLSLVVLRKDSLIDSLTWKLNGNHLKGEKEKTKITASAKKSVLTREQEYDKKALFIYNFTKYIEWPIEYNGTDFIMGVECDDQVLKLLQEFMSQKKVSGKKITVEKYKKGKKYNLVYITSVGLPDFKGIKNNVKRTKTLLVTDQDVSGSHISFSIDLDKVRYIVDKPAIERSGMKVGQELMRYSG
jgi:hypothetical protein